MSSGNIADEEKEEEKNVVARQPAARSSASRRILNTVAEAKNKLRRKDVKEINNGMREAAKEEQLQVVTNAKNTVKTANKISEIKAETDILKEKNKQIPDLIKNMEMKTLQSQIDRKNDFNDALNENKKEEIKNYKRKAVSYRKYSMMASIISAITSCIGLWCEAGGGMPDIALCLSFFVMICVSVFVNIVLNNIPYIIKNFIDISIEVSNGKKETQLLDVVLKYGVYILVGSGVCYSIFTNYLFWSTVNNNTFSCWIASGFFDITAVIISLMVYKYDMMDFRVSYVEKINAIDNELLKKYENKQDTQTEEKESDHETNDKQLPSVVCNTQQNPEEQNSQTSNEQAENNLINKEKNVANVIDINDSKKKEDEIEKKTNLKV